MMKVLSNRNNNTTVDLHFTLTIKDYNQNATAKLDVNLIITDLEEINRSPTTEEKKRYMHHRNSNYENTICSLSCNNNLYFPYIYRWLRTKKIIPYVGKVIYDFSLTTTNKGVYYILISSFTSALFSPLY